MANLYAFQELNLLMCFNLKLLSSIANYIITKKALFFQPIRFQLDVIFNDISIILFSSFKKIIHNFQVNCEPPTLLVDKWKHIPNILQLTECS